MSNQEQAQLKKRTAIPVSFPEHLRGGVYSNLMKIDHTREEFIMVFL